ncbi:hypothetical protein ACFL5V_07190 [Fibrobacterota bacterium]
MSKCRNKKAAFAFGLASLIIILFQSCIKDAADDPGLKLRILSSQVVTANIDSSGITHMDPQAILAEGGAPFDNYNWSFVSGSNPPLGIAIHPFTGVFSGTGSAATCIVPGNTILHIKVSDGTASATGYVTLNVSQLTPGPEAVLQQWPLSEFQLGDAQANKPYGASLFVLGGKPPYSWKKDASYSQSAEFDLSGLSIDNVNGLVRGAVSNSASGKTLRFRVVVTDITGDTAVYNPAYIIEVK